MNKKPTHAERKRKSEYCSTNRKQTMLMKSEQSVRFVANWIGRVSNKRTFIEAYFYHHHHHHQSLKMRCQCLALNNETEDGGLKRHNPRTISRIPGLNPDCPELAKAQAKQFQIKKWCHENSRKNLLSHEEFHPNNNEIQTTTDTGDVTRKIKVISLNGDNEVPLVDQIINKQHETKKTLRPELLPVDDKTKLYFAYNRKTGTISRVITTSPRTFKFGRINKST